MTDYFQKIPNIKYEGKDSKNPLSFKYYEADKKILGKTLEEHLQLREEVVLDVVVRLRRRAARADPRQLRHLSARHLVHTERCRVDLRRQPR